MPTEQAENSKGVRAFVAAQVCNVVGHSAGTRTPRTTTDQRNSNSNNDNNTTHVAATNKHEVPAKLSMRRVSHNYMKNTWQ